MFAGDSLTTTYSGPIRATGENFRRARNEARAMGSFVGQTRAMIPQNTGVGAGSRMYGYRAGIEADRRMADQNQQSQQPLLSGLMSDAEADFAYRNNSAGEMSQLRSLDQNRRTIDQNFDLTKRGDQFDSQLFGEQLALNKYLNDLRIRNNWKATFLGAA